MRAGHHSWEQALHQGVPIDGGGAAPALTPAGARVLIVDDQPEVRRMLRRVLGSGRCETVDVEGADAAIALVRETRFDLVVSDVHMPETGGVELLQALHEVDPCLPVVLLSGAPDLDTALKAVRYGAFEYVAKPISVSTLLDTVSRAVEAGRKRREEQDAARKLKSGERPRSRSAGVGEAISPGTLLGCYRVERLIGSGGMGAVYDAVRPDLAGMRVAIKVMHEQLRDDRTYLARFRREAETAAAVDHPNIVRILDFQASEEEPAFLVMERLEGASLADTLTAQGGFSQQRAAFIGTQVASAVEAAHRAGILHRDLKPENVFLTSISGMQDIVKVLDFGVAKRIDAPPDSKLTQTGTVIGTPAYLAPEQARGGSADIRSDVYSVGCLLYQILTGSLPFQAPNYNAVLFAIQQSDAVALASLRPDLDSGLVAAVEKAMAKDPNARFQTAAELAAALAPWAGLGRPAEPAPPSSSPMAFAPTVARPGTGPEGPPEGPSAGLTSRAERDVDPR